MKTAAIICEFNPLHTGHKKIIDYAKSVADFVICIMSGNFTQRGMPACADKYSRAKHAIMSGADLVVELPTVFATASAENFAYGAVKTVNALQTDYLVFGSECGDLEMLRACADKLKDEQINRIIKAHIARGVSYPKAVAQAIDNDLLNGPNNTLAIEYLQAMRLMNCNATALTLKREGDFNAQTAEQFASSALLRQHPALRPTYTFDFVEKDINDDVEQIYCNFATLYMSLTNAQTLIATEGVTEGLQNRIIAADKLHGYNAMIESIKSKRYTRLKLQRIVLNAVLQITKQTVNESKIAPPSVNALAVSTRALSLLSRTNGITDDTTKRADNLYNAMIGRSPSTKLLKI